MVPLALIWEDAGAATLSGGAWAGAAITPQMTSLCGLRVHPVSLGSREERAAHVLPPGSEPGPPHPLTSLLAPQPQGQLPLRVSAEKVLLTQQPASLEPLGPEARTEPMAPSLPLRLGPALGGPPACASIPAWDCAYCRSGWGAHQAPKTGFRAAWSPGCPEHFVGHTCKLGSCPQGPAARNPRAGLRPEDWGLSPSSHPPCHRPRTLPRGGWDLPPSEAALAPIRPPSL